MSRSMMLVLAMAALLSTATAATAQTERISEDDIATVDVAVDYQALRASKTRPAAVAIDFIGVTALADRLKYRLREELRGSKGITLENDDQDAVFILSIYVTKAMPASQPDDRTAIAYSVRSNWTVLDRRLSLTEGVMVAGTTQVEEAARIIVAKLDSAIVDWQRAQGTR